MSSSSNLSQRVPLSNNTNSLVPSRSPSPQDVRSKPIAIRRRVSFRNLHPRVDSSEDSPSIHASIFDAPYCSSSEGDSGEKYNAKTSQIRVALGLAYGEEACPRAGEASGANTPGNNLGPRDRWTRLGGTTLETIRERKSVNTIRSSASLPRAHSLDDAMPSNLQSPIADVPPIAQARRKLSFSFDDVIRLDSVKMNSNSSAADGILLPPRAYYDYASPKMPTRNPPERIPTPPGLPSWSASGRLIAPSPDTDTASTARPPRRRGFFLRSSPQRAPLPLGLAISDTPDGLQVTNQRQFATAPSGRSRFRPPPSGYRSYGALDMHPFHQAPIAKPWEPTTRSINSRSASSRHRGTSANSAMNMQYMRPPIQSSANYVIGTTPPASVRPAPCPHMKSNPYCGPNSQPCANANLYQHPQPPTNSCWRCHLTRWAEQLSTCCCGDVGDYHEGTGYQHFSTPPLPAQPRYNIAGI